MKMRRCEGCGTYTLKGNCPKCGKQTNAPYPPSFSPEDKYGKYRRAVKLKSKLLKSELK